MLADPSIVDTGTTAITAFVGGCPVAAVLFWAMQKMLDQHTVAMANQREDNKALKDDLKGAITDLKGDLRWDGNKERRTPATSGN